MVGGEQQYTLSSELLYSKQNIYWAITCFIHSGGRFEPQRLGFLVFFVGKRFNNL